MIRFVALSGFLGAGKTTTMLAATKRLEAGGHRVAVITNDQSKELVDTRLARNTVDAVGEVTGGCFCCRFEDLVEVTAKLVAEHAPDTIIAESVGSCTDLQATVVRPLHRYYGATFTMAPLTTIVDPLRFRAFARAWERGEPETDLTYLFRQQLEEAEIIAISKVDSVTPAIAASTEQAVQRYFPHARTVAYSALSGHAVDSLLGQWTAESCSGRNLDIDYDRYAAAEAELAWLNEVLELRADPANGVVPLDWGRIVMRRLGEVCAARGVLVGHAKITLDCPAGLTKLSITGVGPEPAVDTAVAVPVLLAGVSINARMACDPAELDTIVATAVAEADARLATTSTAATSAAFKPSYPRPRHRIAAGGRG